MQSCDSKIWLVVAYFDPECIEHVHKTLRERILHSYDALKLNVAIDSSFNIQSEIAKHRLQW